jgi:hypothetical protein
MLSKRMGNEVYERANPQTKKFQAQIFHSLNNIVAYLAQGEFKLKLKR